MLDFVGKSFDAIYTVSDESICHTDFLTPVGFLRVFAHILAMHRGWGLLGSDTLQFLGFLLQEFYRQASRDPWK